MAMKTTEHCQNVHKNQQIVFMQISMWHLNKSYERYGEISEPASEKREKNQIGIALMAR